MEKPRGIENKTGPDKHFHMSGNYKENSLSQQTIGSILIENAIAFAKKELKDKKQIQVLDIACGPGNLTFDLEEKLKNEFPNTEINLTGLDYSEDNIKLLEKNYGDSIKGVIGSFYDLPIEKESQDVVVSNEGLHWQPPYEMSEIIYAQLPKQEKIKYESWALNNFKIAIKNIYDSLKEEGVLVIQFGHEGQLDKLWNLVRSSLEQEQFQNYKEKVNFPLFYPKMEDIKKILNEVGFKNENIQIEAFNQDLTENSPESITRFLKAFTEVCFSKFFKGNDLNDFYKSIESKISELDIDEFRKDQWHRTLIKLKK